MDRNLRIRMVLEASDRFTRPVREMVGGSNRLAASLKATRDRLKDIQRAQADVAGFRSLKRGVGETEAAMRQAQARASALGRAIANADRPTRAMTRDFNAAKREAEQLARQHQQQTGELGQLRDRLRAAGIETTSLARHERELRTAAAGTNREIEEQSRRLAQAGDRARRFGAARAGFQRTMGVAGGMAASGTAAIGTGVALAAPVFGSIKAAQDYQSVMTDIAQKADLTRAQAEALGRQLLVNARAANQMPDAMQAGVDTLSGLGAKVPDAVRMMGPIGKAATAYKAEIADLSAASFAAADNLKVPVAQTERVIEMMAQAGKAGAFEVKDMATYFPTLTAAYQGLGQKGVNSVGDLAAALQITRKGAGDSASAATNLSNVLQKMMSPDTIKNFQKFGIDLPAALKRAYAEGKTPIEAIAELTNKALGGDATKVGNLDKLGFIFGDAQVQQGLRPLIQNMAEYRRIRDEAQGKASVGSVDRDFAERMQDSAEQTRQLKVNAAALGVSLGSTLLPAVNRVLSGVTAFANRLSSWAQANPGFAKAIIVAAAAFAFMFMVLGGGAVAIAGILAPFAALQFAATALGISLLPVIGTALAVIAAIAGLAAIGYAIYKHWDGIAAFFANIWAQIRAGVAGGIGGIAALLTNFSPVGLLYTGFAALMNWLGISMPSRLSQAGMELLNGLIRGITSRLAAVKNAVVGAANSVVGWFKGALGIRSPSRVFMGLGGFLTQGLALGIDRGARAPVDRLRSIARNMIAASAVTLPAVVQPAAAATARAVTQAPPRIAAVRQATSKAAPVMDVPRVGPLASILPPARPAPMPQPVLRTVPTIPAPMPQRALREAPATAARLADAVRVTLAGRDTVGAPITAARLAEAIRVTLAGREAEAAIAPTPATARSEAPRSAPPAPRSERASLGPISITINGSPGQSAQDIAEAVRDELDRIRREDAARERSTFRDRQDEASLD